MRRTPLALVTAVAVVTALTALPAAAGGRSARTCTPAHTETVLVNARVRVYRKADLFFVCAFSTRRSIRLISNERGVDGYGPFRLTGKYVAFGFYPSCGDCEDEGNDMIVLDAVRAREKYFIGLDTDDDGLVTRLTDLEVNGRGSAAWIARDAENRSNIRVEKVEGAGGPVLLDSGPDIDPTSLARSGPTLYWTKGGVSHSAPLN